MLDFVKGNKFKQCDKCKFWLFIRLFLIFFKKGGIHYFFFFFIIFFFQKEKNQVNFVNIKLIFLGL